MLDIEFLAEPPRSLKKFILYEYSDGIFGLDIRKNFRRMLAERGIPVRDESPDKFLKALMEKSLFGFYCVWTQINTPEELEKLLPGIIGTDFGHYCYLEVNRNSIGTILESEQYSLYKKSATMVQEIEVTSRNISKVVTFLVEFYSKKFQIILENSDQMIQGLMEYFELDQVGLGNLANFTEKVLLMCVNENVFDLNTFKKILPAKIESNFLEWHKAIADLIQTGSKAHQLKLLQLVDNSLSLEIDQRQIMGKMFKATQELSQVNKILNPSGQKPDQIGDYKWRNLTHWEGLRTSRILKFQLLLALLEVEINTGGSILNYRNTFNKMLI